MSRAMRTAAAAVRFPRSRLQQIQLAALDRELEVLHVAEVPLEPVLRLEQLRVRLGQLRRHLVDVERRANARDDVLALRVDEELAVELPSPVDGSRVNATPVPESSPRLPNTIDTTFTAVPRSSGMLFTRR